MSAIFISYARASEDAARAVAEQLRALGHTVWRDDELPAHRSYGEVIEERLRSARAVVVLWSAEAAKSQWVRAEADLAREAGTLVQLSCDGTVPPLPFNQIQCADLRGWTGDRNHPGWKKVVDSVAVLAGTPTKLRPSASTRPSSAGPMLCVLPFINMSGDSDQEYFSDGITEDVITDLSKVSALDVVARNTAFAFKGQVVDIKAVSRDLGLTHVIEGSVRKAGERVRITAQLIEGSSGKHLWAERYDRDLDDIFAIQDEISKAIVAALKVTLLPNERKAIEQRGTQSPEAYDLYLLARQHWITGSGSDRRAMGVVERICRQAIALDENYARAWGLMALAQVRLKATFDVETAPEPAIERALALDPDNVEAICAKVIVLSYTDDRDRGTRLIERALEIDPQSFEVQKTAAREYFQLGNLDKAIEHYEKALPMVEDDFHSAGMLVTCYNAKGDQANAERAARICIERSERALAKDPTNGAALGMGTAGLATLNDPRTEKWIDRALLIDPDNLLMRYNIACSIVSLLEDNDKAIEVLTPYFENIGPESLVHITVDPDMDKIRDDPRFQHLLEATMARLAKTAAETRDE